MKAIEVAKEVGRRIDAGFRWVAKRFEEHPKTMLGVTLAIFVLSHLAR